MRNSVVLIDTNILLNYITNREDPYLEQSVEIVRKCAIGECTGYIAFHTLSTLCLCGHRLHHRRHVRD